MDCVPAQVAMKEGWESAPIFLSRALSLSAYCHVFSISSSDQHLVLSGQCSREKVRIPSGSLQSRGNRMSVCATRRLCGCCSDGIGD